MTHHDAEMDAIVAELEAAGLVTVGGDIVTLTPAGEQLAGQLAMSGEVGHDALMGALLDEQGGR